MARSTSLVRETDDNMMTGVSMVRMRSELAMQEEDRLVARDAIDGHLRRYDHNPNREAGNDPRQFEVRKLRASSFGFPSDFGFWISNLTICQYHRKFSMI